MSGKYHMNGVTPDYQDLETTKKDVAHYAKINGRHYFIYRVIGAVLADGSFVDASSPNFHQLTKP